MCSAGEEQASNNPQRISAAVQEQTGGLRAQASAQQPRWQRLGLRTRISVSVLLRISASKYWAFCLTDAASPAVRGVLHPAGSCGELLPSAAIAGHRPSSPGCPAAGPASWPLGSALCSSGGVAVLASATSSTSRCFFQVANIAPKSGRGRKTLQALAGVGYA